MGQGQIRVPNKRQVGSRQRQVASLLYSRTPPNEHSAQANTPLERTILAGPKHFLSITMFKNPSLGEQPRPPGQTNALPGP